MHAGSCSSSLSISPCPTCLLCICSSTAWDAPGLLALLQPGFCCWPTQCLQHPRVASATGCLRFHRCMTHQATPAVTPLHLCIDLYQYFALSLSIEKRSPNIALKHWFRKKVFRKRREPFTEYFKENQCLPPWKKLFCSACLITWLVVKQFFSSSSPTCVNI